MRYTVDVWAWRDACPETQDPDWAATYQILGDDEEEAVEAAEARADRALNNNWQQLVAARRTA